MKVKDKNRAELVKAIVGQNKGRIFTVVAKRKNPKSYFIVGRPNVDFIGEPTFNEGDKIYLNTKKNRALLERIQEDCLWDVSVHTDNFMEMTCRTGVTKHLAGGDSTIRHCDDLISVNVIPSQRSNEKDTGYRCFSAFNVLEIRAGGTVIKFKESDVLEFNDE